MLRKISHFLVLLAFAVCLWLWFEHTSFWQDNLRVTAENCRVSGLCFSEHGPPTYGFLSERYFYIAIFLVFAFLGNFIKERMLSLAVCLVALFLTTYQFWQIYGWYSIAIEQFADYETKPYFSLLRSSVPYIWICVYIVVFLILLQILLFFLRLSFQRDR